MDGGWTHSFSFAPLDIPNTHQGSSIVGFVALGGAGGVGVVVNGLNVTFCAAISACAKGSRPLLDCEAGFGVLLGCPKGFGALLD
jgi:hypothetical protein